MGGFGQAPLQPGATTPKSSDTAGLTTEYEANKPQQMPVYNSPAQVESARKKRQEIVARSGRTSTNLRGNPGTISYQNSFLGNVA
jgi:hypothetical protein